MLRRNNAVERFHHLRQKRGHGVGGGVRKDGDCIRRVAGGGADATRLFVEEVRLRSFEGLAMFVRRSESRVRQRELAKAKSKFRKLWRETIKP